MSQSDTMPKLAKPGAGLPFPEWFVAKYFLFPKRFRETSISQGIEEYVLESEKIEQLIAPLTDEQLAERRLIPRLRGLEDNSRYWSVAMALQHMVIVSNGMTRAILALAAGKTDLPRRGVADVKPSENVDPKTIRAEFGNCWRGVIEKLKDQDIEQFPSATYPHPWFGPLNAKQWSLFLAPHQQIHHQQIIEIISRL